ncbi:hypothetical protein BOX15_Mlig003408g2 [Macrostomum lignano]|uniref:Cysteine/serine-rich nuclear protein N-terminal domain-containing protein n=2 Tax=Macrostomum lignano TaxID=282301 RepID=A0A267H4K7_9PLAT|nr:hypothetical protein BOX15_Mlig003408g2 [Macrostomum lignano]
MKRANPQFATPSLGSSEVSTDPCLLDRKRLRPTAAASAAPNRLKSMTKQLSSSSLVIRKDAALQRKQLHPMQQVEPPYLPTSSTGRGRADNSQVRVQLLPVQAENIRLQSMATSRFRTHIWRHGPSQAMSRSQSTACLVRSRSPSQPHPSRPHLSLSHAVRSQSPPVTRSQSPSVTRSQSPSVTRSQSPSVTRSQSPSVTRSQSPSLLRSGPQSRVRARSQSPSRPPRSLFKCRRHSPSRSQTGQSRPTRRVRFADQIRAFLFERALGFSCVPSRGSVGLGMQLNHCAVESLAPHDRPVDDNNSSSSTGYSAAFGFRLAEDGQALSPLPVRSRRQLLRESGVRRADSAEERAECRLIRASRERCGCDCPDGCILGVCPCAGDEIPCQVDRAGFPCACARPEACANPAGRLEFNPSRVRAHYVHTAHRLSLESEQQQADLFTPDGSCSVCADVDNVQDQCSTMPLTGAPLLTAANDMPTAT